MAARLQVFHSLPVVCAILMVLSSFAQSDSNITVMVRSPVATSSEATSIMVYRGDVQRSVTFDKAVLIGNSLDNQFLQFKNNNPRVPNGTMPDPTTEPATLTLPVTMTTAERTGIYSITVTEDDGAETVFRVLITNEDATVTAAEYSTVVSQGGSVTLRTVLDDSVDESKVRWRIDGDFQSTPSLWTASFRAITAQNSQVFECFLAGHYFLNVHAIMNLIVRGCPENKTGPGCMDECPLCINGGICSDKTASCLCPPGFSGDHCQNVHGRNVFGQNAEYKCNDTADDHGDGCKGAIICYPEPFGCICPAGYAGIDCLQECTEGKFGANCKEDCHCQGNVSCTKDTGECPDSQCAEGWKGINCQVESPCEVGVYGDLCTLPCSCESGDCSDVALNCIRGCAVLWTGEACDENSGVGMITNLTYIKVNPGVSTSVTCSAIRNPVLEEDGLQLMNTEGNVLAMIISSSSSVVGDKNYTRSNTWMVTGLQSDPVSMASCVIRGTNISRTVELIPYELLQYSSSRLSLLNFSAVSSTSITITWLLWDPHIDIGDGPIQEYLIEYREGGSSFSQAVRTSTGFSHEVTNLKADTLYEFRIVLVREGLNGDGPPSDIQSQRTLCGEFTMSPALILESSTSRTAAFRFEIPSRDHWSCSSITATLQRQQSDGQWIEEMNLGTASGTVDVRNLFPCTSYTFRVQLDNGPRMNTSQSVEVITQPEALIVRDLTLSAATTGQLHVSWSPPDTSQTNCDVSMYTIIYRLVRHVTCISDVTESANMTVTTESTFITLNDLSDFAEYDVIVRADADTKRIGMRKVGTTLPAAPSVAPVNITLTNISSTCLVFSWEPIPCYHRNGEIEYQYSLNSSNGTTESSTNVAFIKICDLIPYVEHYFKVRASTSVGPGPDSEIVIGTTEEDVPPQLDPPEFPFTNTSSLQIVWKIPNPPHGVVTGYNISVQLLSDGPSNTFFILVSVDAHDAGNPPSYLLRDLVASRDYSIMVRANTRIGPGKWSLPIIATTKEGLPSSPQNLSVSEKTKEVITVEWDIPKKPRGNIIAYEISYQAVEKPYIRNFQVGSPNPKNISSTDTHLVYRITSLEPSTVYRVEVSAYTSAGQGDISNISEHTDIADGFTAVSIRDIPHPTRNGAMATIILPSLTEKYATHYFIRVKISPHSKRSVGGIGSFEDNPSDYITGEIPKSEKEESFIIGDGKRYGMYQNVPLQESKEYEIFIGTGSRVGKDAKVVWSDPFALSVNEFMSSLSVLVVLAVLLVVAIIVCLLVTMVIVRRKTRAKNNKDVMVSEYAETDKPKDSFSAMPLRQKPPKETEQKPYENVDVCREPSYLEPSACIITHHQLEKEYPAPSLNIFKLAEEKTGGQSLNSGNVEYEETDIHNISGRIKTLPDKNKKRGILPAALLTDDVDLSCMRSSEMYEEIPDFATSQAKVDGPCSIKIKDLPDLLRSKNMDPEDTLRDEFLKLPQAKQHPWTVGALKDENPSSGILPYDHSRVKLEKNSSGLNVDYYNANFIKDQHSEKGFIAAQGPTRTTLENFWRMVWDHNVQLIVNLSELTRTACQYWPSGIETNKTYGDITVIWCDNLTDCCDFSIREMKVIKGDKIHEIKLCQFLSWPENDSPHQPAVVLDFIKKVKTFRTKQFIPVLVHCSNGVGSTGAFIAIYCLLEGLRNRKKNLTADVFEFVTKMRKNRVDMVQNESQYTFVFETLTTALLTPENVMSADRLLEMDLNLQKDVLAQEYQVMTALCKVMTPRTSQVGQSQENTNKNRFQAVIPLDSCRVVLKSPGCSVGSNDYINGSLVNSSYLRDGFIMTQAPLATTVEDFWRMVHDYDCAAIVSLNEMDENDEEVYFYWPEGGKVQYGNMSVKCMDVFTHKNAYIERHLQVKHRKFQKEVAVHHYQLSVWPEHRHQSEALVEIILKVQPLVESKQRIVVHCLDGVRRSGIFLTVMTEMLHLKTCKEVELFRTIHNMKGKNPHMVTELEDYLLCYQLLKSSLMAEESAYANIKE